MTGFIVIGHTPVVAIGKKRFAPMPHRINVAHIVDYGPDDDEGSVINVTGDRSFYTSEPVEKIDMKIAEAVAAARE